MAEEIKPLVFKIINEINERDLLSMNPTELKGILDICYKMISQIYGLGNPQVQVTQIDYPQINFKWDWEQDDQSIKVNSSRSTYRTIRSYKKQLMNIDT